MIKQVMKTITRGQPMRRKHVLPIVLTVWALLMTTSFCINKYYGIKMKQLRLEQMKNFKPCEAEG